MSVVVCSKVAHNLAAPSDWLFAAIRSVVLFRLCKLDMTEWWLKCRTVMCTDELGAAKWMHCMSAILWRHVHGASGYIA